MEDHKLTLENPGYIRVGKKQIRLGGVSDPRNKGLMKMFNMIDIGERAGSGVPDIFNVWNDEGGESPEIIEEFNPDRTKLILSFEKRKKQAIKTNDKKTNDKITGAYRQNCSLFERGRRGKNCGYCRAIGSKSGSYQSDSC